MRKAAAVLAGFAAARAPPLISSAAVVAAEWQHGKRLMESLPLSSASKMGIRRDRLGGGGDDGPHFAYAWDRKQGRARQDVEQRAKAEAA